MNGGIILSVAGQIIDLDGQTGQQLWAYQDPPVRAFGSDGQVAVSADGIIYFREGIPSAHGYIWSLIGLDGSTGSEVVNIPMPANGVQIFQDFCHGDSATSTGGPALSMTDPVIGPDGTVFSAVVSYNYTTTACSGVANYTQNLSMLEVNASGAVSNIPYNSVSMPVNTRQVEIADVIPDGQGGALISTDLLGNSSFAGQFGIGKPHHRCIHQRYH